MKITKLLFILEMLFWPVFLGSTSFLVVSKLSIHPDGGYNGLLLGGTLGAIFTIQKIRARNST
jgi:hypothetical protein